MSWRTQPETARLTEGREFWNAAKLLRFRAGGKAEGASATVRRNHKVMPGRTTSRDFVKRPALPASWGVRLWQPGHRNCPDFIERRGRFCYTFDLGEGAG